MNIYHRLILLTLSFFITGSLYTQEQDTVRKTTDALFYYGFVQYDAEYYKIDSKNSILDHHISYQPYLDNINIFSIEFGVVNSFQDEGQYVTPSDLFLNYRRNFLSAKYGNKGYQGTTAGIKFIIPTGKSEFLSGYNSWSLEPIVGSAWQLENKAWAMGYLVRYYYSFAALPATNPRFDFFRAEFYCGYETSRFGIYVQPEYRFIPTEDNHNLFLKADFNVNVNSKLGFKVAVKPRLIGDYFSSYFTSLGFYLFL